MTIPNEEVVRSVLAEGGRSAILYDAVVGGWTDYLNSSEAGRWRRKGTRAAIVWERVVDRALSDLFNDPGISVIEKDDSIHFLVEDTDTVYFRFKKGNERRLSQNYPTKTALAYHNHQADLLDRAGAPAIHRVEIVYVLNSRETAVQAVCVVARQRNDIIWHYELDDTGRAIEPLPLLPTSPRPTTKLVRVKPDVQKPKKNDQSK